MVLMTPSYTVGNLSFPQIYSFCMALLQQFSKECLFLWMLFLLRITWITSDPNLRSMCVTHQSCGRCIAAHYACEWCKEEKFEDSRCNLRENLIKGGCPLNSITQVQTESVFLENNELSKKGEKTDHLIQLQPQHIYLKLRPKKPYTFKVYFSQAEDYPVDLYYLMDLSYSMLDDKKTLADLGDKLATSMSKITSNFRLGFGSFVDKVALPFVFTYPPFLNNPCADNNHSCKAAYSFKNHLSLTLNTSRFAHEVRSAPISGNIDFPEGGFDAIMQAIVCKHQIGWRMQSRKIILFSSDASFHYAGDGKVAGIVEPNDGLCHLNEDMHYTMAEKQDYPSVGQLNHKAREHKVNIIFAVGYDMLHSYVRLSQIIEGASASILNNDSSNIVQLVREQYEQISSEIELRHSVPNDVKISYSSRCLGNDYKETNICKGLKLGSLVSFDVTIQVDSCKEKENYKIYPVGLTDELLLTVETICECDCEKPENEEINSWHCSEGNGTYECGICNCNPGRYGHFCECDSNILKQFDHGITCQSDNATGDCSNRGQCVCGICLCDSRESPDEKIYGANCECDNFSCLKYNDLLCGGPKHGICECGECLCNEQWTGEACDCPTSLVNCLNPVTKEICSNQGECICGECVCNISNPRRIFSGKFCDICVGCECDGSKKDECDNPCDRLKPCLTCEDREEENKVCHDVCHLYDIQDVDDWDYNITITGPQCHVKSVVDPGCVYSVILNYTLSTEDKKVYLRRKVCEKAAVNVFAIGLGVSLTVLALGLLLLLIWKIVTYFYDKREYENFEKERRCAKFDKGENPIYRRAVSSFRNPAYSASHSSVAEI